MLKVYFFLSYGWQELFSKIIRERRSQSESGHWMKSLNYGWYLNLKLPQTTLPATFLLKPQRTTEPVGAVSETTPNHGCGFHFEEIATHPIEHWTSPQPNPTPLHQTFPYQTFFPTLPKKKTFFPTLLLWTPKPLFSSNTHPTWFFGPSAPHHSTTRETSMCN